MGWFLSQLESCPQTTQTHSHQSILMGFRWLKPPPEHDIIAYSLMLYGFIIHINLSSVVTWCRNYLANATSKSATTTQDFINNGRTCGLDSQTRRRSPAILRINNPPFFFSSAETTMFVPPSTDESLTCNEEKCIYEFIWWPLYSLLKLLSMLL